MDSLPAWVFRVVQDGLVYHSHSYGSTFCSLITSLILVISEMVMPFGKIGIKRQ